MFLVNIFYLAVLIRIVIFVTPGATAKEDFTTGTQAAIAGGVTTVFDMPNTNPSVLNEQDLIAKSKLFCS